jgi:hypothetical protein
MFEAILTVDHQGLIKCDDHFYDCAMS